MESRLHGEDTAEDLTQEASDSLHKCLLNNYLQALFWQAHRIPSVQAKNFLIDLRDLGGGYPWHARLPASPLQVL